MSASSGTLVSALPRRRGWTRLATLLGDYVALTRPRVLALVLFSAPAAMALGQPGWRRACWPWC
jgi:heme O synthase-like polyprenyltransferase